MEDQGLSGGRIEEIKFRYVIHQLEEDVWTSIRARLTREHPNWLLREEMVKFALFREILVDEHGNNAASVAASHAWNAIEQGPGERLSKYLSRFQKAMASYVEENGYDSRTGDIIDVLPDRVKLDKLRFSLNVKWIQEATVTYARSRTFDELRLSLSTAAATERAVDERIKSQLMGSKRRSESQDRSDEENVNQVESSASEYESDQESSSCMTRGRHRRR